MPPNALRTPRDRVPSGEAPPLRFSPPTDALRSRGAGARLSAFGARLTRVLRLFAARVLVVYSALGISPKSLQAAGPLPVAGRPSVRGVVRRTARPCVSVW